MKRILAAAMVMVLPATALAATGTPLQVKTAAGSTAGTVTTGGTFQTLLAPAPSRLGCQIINPTTATEALYVYIGTGTATTPKSIPLVPGGVFTCNFGSIVLTDQISVEATTTSHAFVYMTE